MANCSFFQLPCAQTGAGRRAGRGPWPHRLCGAAVHSGNELLRRGWPVDPVKAVLRQERGIAGGRRGGMRQRNSISSLQYCELWLGMQRLFARWPAQQVDLDWPGRRARLGPGIDQAPEFEHFASILSRCSHVVQTERITQPGRPRRTSLSSRQDWAIILNHRARIVGLSMVERQFYRNFNRFHFSCA